MKRVVVIGGGHGLAAILRGIKHLDNIHISAIVSVADDGGSSGVLRKEFDIPPVGDIRDVIVSLAQSETLISNLMNYRFDAKEDEVGHSLGNLMIAALYQTTGSLIEAIQVLSEALGVKGDIIPSSLDQATLLAIMEDGTKVVGESNIPTFNNKINEIKYLKPIQACEEAVEAIAKADFIILGLGSLYTSVIPNIIIEEIQEAIALSQAPIIYMCNAMSESGETDGFNVCDHVSAIEKHLKSKVDAVVVANNKIPDHVLKRYEKSLTHPILLEDYHDKDIVLIKEDLLTFDHDVVRHDSEKIKKVFERIVSDEYDLCQKC